MNLLWHIIVEADIQGASIQGKISCHATTKDMAAKLARQTFIKYLRNSGVWAGIEEVELPDEEDKEKTIQVTQYVAPYWNHVKVLKFVTHGDYSFTYCAEELEKNARDRNGVPVPTAAKKRRTSGEVAIVKRKQKQKQLDHKEKKVEQQQKAVTNKQSKEDLLRTVEKHFTVDTAQVIKEAAIALDETYQRVRYALFQIRDKGYDSVEYALEQTKIDGSTAFRLIKKG